MRNIFLGKEISRFSMSILLAVALAALAGCGAGVADTASSATPATSFSLLASPSTVNSDGLTSSTITVVALNAANAAVSGVVATLSADSGILSDATITTGTGAAPVTVTFSPGASKINRTATITATAGGVSSQIPVQIVGSTVTVTSSGATLPDNGQSPVTLTITAKDSGRNAVPNAAVTLTQTGSGRVTLTPASGTTNASGQLTVEAKGAGAGAATISVAALGATATTALTVSPTTATFAIDQLNGVDALNTAVTAMKIGHTLTVRVNSLNATNVTFATTTGTWNGGTSSVVTVPAVAGKATASLTTTQAGVATVQVYDAAAPATSDSLTVAMTSTIAASITIQPSPSVVARSVGTTTGSSTLIAMVRDANGFPVGDAPVSFSIVNPTGGGETVSPVVVLSASTTAGGLNLGEARTSFTSGSASSGANGVHIRASVVGTTVATEAFDPITLQPVNLTSSGNDATIIMGGTSGSVAFGTATVLTTDASNANYVLEMSVMVTDSNGNPAPLGTVVNLSVWPQTFSTGAGCARDPDSPATAGTPAVDEVPAVAGVAGVPEVPGVGATGSSGVAGDLTITAAAAAGAAANGYRVTIVVNTSVAADSLVVTSNATAATVTINIDSTAIGYVAGQSIYNWTQVASALNANPTFFASKTASTANGGALVLNSDAQVITLAGGVNAVAAIPAVLARAAIPARPAIPAGPARGTFYNEDINENLILDTGEDGRRDWYISGLATTQGTSDGYATPPSSAAGSVPSTILTDANGVAAFKLTYPKKSAIWITDRMRARTVVQGTEMVGEIILYLAPTVDEGKPGPDTCKLPDSPYFF